MWYRVESEKEYPMRTESRTTIQAETDIISGRLEKAWAVFTTDDDRGSRGTFVGVFTGTESGKADHAAKGKGYYGGVGRVELTDILMLNDGTCLRLVSADRVPVNVDLIERARADKRTAAQKFVQRFTAEEAKILGVDYDAMLKAST
jgi:hypothetical protein